MRIEKTLISPLDGKIVPLEQVPDPVFSEHMLGNGLAILPTSQIVFAPIEGTVVNINAAKHALVIKKGELEVLVHVGLESVSLKGEGFELFVREGQEVRSGQKLLSFDVDILHKKAASTLVLLVITSPTDTAITILANEHVKTGLPLFSLSTTLEDSVTRQSLEMCESNLLVVQNPVGLHARPASILANIAAQYPYLVEIHKDRKCADVKSIVSLMGLSLQKNDAITFRVFGPKAESQALLDNLVNTFQTILGPQKKSSNENNPQKINGPILSHGICACGGLAAGPAFLFKSSTFSFEENTTNPDKEREALHEALTTLSQQMEKRLTDEKSTVARDILHAHLLLLKDPLLADTTRQIIEQGKTAAFAFNSAIRRSVDILKQTKNNFLMERIADLKDLRREVLCQLTGQQQRALSIPQGSIIIADELLPSDVSALPDHTAGVILANGSPTSHAGILLRNRNIPSLVRMGTNVLDIPSETMILLNANDKIVIQNPSEIQKKEFDCQVNQLQEQNKKDSKRAQEPATTRDGLRVYVEGNIANPEEAACAYAAGAEGIGLVRTEFLFQDRPFAPTEQEQFVAYQMIMDAFPGQPITFRMLDAGGDKPMPFINISPEENPIVGIRGIRALENNEKFFRTQLRALLRLPQQERVRIMLPMVTFEEELIRFKQIFKQEIVSLELKTAAQLGIMVEVPSAALQAKQLAPYVDFFSIGTNDLTQYTLAIDRNHKDLSPLASALHPAVLQLIAHTCEGAQTFQKPVSVCGALASEADAVPFLIGLGVSHLAVSTGAVARTKATIRHSNYHRCRNLALQALQQSSVSAVRELSKQYKISESSGEL